MGVGKESGNRFYRWQGVWDVRFLYFFGYQSYIYFFVKGSDIQGG